MGESGHLLYITVRCFHKYHTLYMSTRWEKFAPCILQESHSSGKKKSWTSGQQEWNSHYVQADLPRTNSQAGPAAVLQTTLYQGHTRWAGTWSPSMGRDSWFLTIHPVNKCPPTINSRKRDICMLCVYRREGRKMTRIVLTFKENS